MENITSYVKDGRVWVCEQAMTGSSVGLKIGEDPTKYPIPVFLLQISLVSSFTAVFRFLLKPFGQLNFISQMLGGIVFGPSFLGHSERLASKLFYTRSMFIIDSYESIGFMFYAFLTTIHVDIGMIKRVGKLAFLNGFSLFLFPSILAWILPHIMQNNTNLATPDMRNSLRHMMFMVTTFNFQVMFGVLSDLNMLNTELGRLALSSGMICNVFGWIYFLVMSSLMRSMQASNISTFVWSHICKVIFILVIVFVFRPTMLWMVKKTPGGKPVKDSYLCTICVMVLLCGFFGEITGLSYIVGTVALGIVTPNKPSLLSSLSDKIGCFVWAVFVPCCLVSTGRSVNVFALCTEDAIVVELIIIFVQMTNFAAVFVPSICYKVPFSHATALGFVVNIQGLYHIQAYKQSLNYKAISTEAFSVMVILAMIHSAIFTSLVRKLYKPTSKCIAYKRRTVQHLRPEAKLGILVCFHKQEAVPSVLDILEVSNPTRGSPISVFALDIEEVADQSVPVLIQHRLDKKPSLAPNRTDKIINAFYQYETQNEGLVSIQCFTAVGAYRTMHEDVCSMALDKDVNLVIVTLDKEDGPLLWLMARNVLENAPCSVGILYERGGLPDFKSLVVKHLKINICIVFLGGSDDREALAYGSRMADHPSVNLLVLRFVHAENFSKFGYLFDRKQDGHAINQFRTKTVTKQNVEYREVRIAQVCDLTETLREMGDEYHMVMVGINHDEDSPVLEGLSEWSETEELGVIGDLLASSDLGLRASVLAVQQQALVVEEMVKGSKSKSSKRRSL